MRSQELLLLVLTFFVSIQMCKAANRIYKNSTQCYYLKMSEGQRANAYSPKSDPDLVCCMCGKGTYWDGDCNPFNPISTICKPCHYSKEDPYDRSFIHFEPHDQPKCFQHVVMQCPHPQVVFEGSAKEESKCLCPEGMTFGRTDKDCIIVPTDASKIRRLTTSDISTEPHSTPETTNAIIKQTLLARITTHDTPTSMADLKNKIGANDEPKQKSYTQEMTTPAEQSETETMSPNQDQNGITMEFVLALLGIIIGCIIIATLAVIFFASYHRNRNRQPRKLIDESPQERRRGGTPQNNYGVCYSSETLAPRPAQDQSRRQNFTELGFDEDPQPENMAQPNQRRVNRNDELVERSPENQPLMVQYTNEEMERQNTANPLPNADLLSEQNHILAYDVHQHIARSPQQIAPSCQSCQIAGRQSAAAMYPDGVAQAIPAEEPMQPHANFDRLQQPQEDLVRRQECGMNPAERPRQNVYARNKRFALAVATWMGTELPAKYASPWYRHLIGNDTQNMQDIVRNYTTPPCTDTGELYYKLMEIAVHELGTRLTPRYLLQKAKEFRGLQVLVEMIEEEMEKDQ